MSEDLSGGTGDFGASVSTGNAALDGSLSAFIAKIQDGALAVVAIGLAILLLLAIVAIYKWLRKSMDTKDEPHSQEEGGCANCGGEGPFTDDGLCQGCETTLNQDDYGTCHACGAFGPVIAVDGSDYRECFGGCQNHGE